MIPALLSCSAIDKLYFGCYEAVWPNGSIIMGLVLAKNGVSMTLFCYGSSTGGYRCSTGMFLVTVPWNLLLGVPIIEFCTLCAPGLAPPAVVLR